MPSLDDVTQRFTADTGPYITAVRAAAAAAREFTAAALEAAAAARAQQDAMNGVDRSAAGTALALRGAASAEGDLRNVTLLLNAILGELRNQTLLLAVSFTYLDDKLAALIAEATATRVAVSSLGDAMTATAAKTAAAGTAARTFGAGWALAGQTIGFWVHVVLMGILEIAATAIPALAALGLAVGAMATTFTHIADQMNNMRAATGSWSGVLANSVPVLQQVGAAMVRMRQAVAPDAYIIFGAAINGLIGHVGAFSSVTQQASNVLATFASKISAELSGPLGGQLVKFFSDSVKFMTQWGQVLGNLGHTFVNVMTDMFGVSHFLLNALVEITHVLEVLTANPVIGWLIGFAAALSAVYRYAVLLGIVFRALIPTQLIGMGEKVVMTFLKMVVAFQGAEDAMAGMDAAAVALDGAIGPLGWAMLAFGVILGGIALSGHNAADATDNLISAQNKLSPTVQNLNNGMDKMSANMMHLVQSYGRLDTAQTQVASVQTRLTGNYQQGSAAQQQYDRDVTNTINEMKSLANQTINLMTGLAQAGQRTGQLGADMNALTIATALTDSKIQQVNQAIDQYIQIATGGTSSVANFITSMSNIGTVAATTANNLGTATVQMSLNTTQFGKVLSGVSATSASAWQNLDQVINGSIAPMLDWFRTAQTLGAATSSQLNTAFLSMIAIVGRWVGSNTTAQNSLLMLANTVGLSYPSFQKLMAAANGVQHPLHTLANTADTVQNKLAKMSAVAKIAANAMNPMVANAIAAAALKTSGFNRSLSKLQTDMMNHAPAAVIEADLQAMQNAYQTGQQYILHWGNALHTQSATGSSDVHTASGKITGDLNTNSGNFTHMENIAKMTMGQTAQHVTDAASKTKTGTDKMNTATDEASHHMGLLAGQTITAMAKFNSAVDGALRHAQALQSFIDSMHGKSITVTTNFVTTHSGSGSGCIPGITCAHGGVMGYAAGGMVAGRYGQDAVPAALTAGEAVLTARAVSALGGPLAVHSLNNEPSEAVTSGNFGKGGGAPVILGLNLGISNTMDGQVVNSIQRRATLIYNRRNPSNNLSLRNR